MPTTRQIFDAFEHNISQFQRQIEGETDETKRKELKELLVRERARRKGNVTE